MRVGKTIGGKREIAESESERLQYHEKVKKRKITSVLIFFAVIAVIFMGVFTVIKGMRREQKSSDDSGNNVAKPTIEIVDEASVGVSRKAREFVGNLEQDLKEYQIKLTRAVLPRNKTREVDVYVDGFEGYFKLSLDRGAGVSAEDLERMLRYLKGLGFKGVEYVDLRVEGKGYYKGAIQAEEEKKEEEPAENNREETEVEIGVEEVEEVAPEEEENSSVFVREGESNGEENPDEIPVYEGENEGE